MNDLMQAIKTFAMPYARPAFRARNQEFSRLDTLSREDRDRIINPDTSRDKLEYLSGRLMGWMTFMEQGRFTFFDNTDWRDANINDVEDVLRYLEFHIVRHRMNVEPPNDYCDYSNWIRGEGRIEALIEIRDFIVRCCRIKTTCLPTTAYQTRLFDLPA